MSTPSAPHPRPPRSGPATPSRLPLALACGGSFLAFLDVTITNLAVPDLTVDLQSGVDAISWVVTVYATLFAALLIPAGRLADVVGRRRLFVAGVALFTTSSLAAAAAPGLGVLLAARAVQGVGAAALIPASLGFVLGDTPPARRAAAIGLWSASAALAAAVGPALGGVVVDALGWRALFAINVPAGALLLAAAARTGADRPAGGRLPDPVGVLSLAVGLAALVVAVTRGDAWGWTAASTAGAVAVGVVALAVAVLRSRRHASPALPLDLWRIPASRAANATSVLFGVGLYGSLLLGVLFLTSTWGYSELEAGLAMVPGAVAAATVGVVAGRRGLPPAPTAAAGALVFGTCLGVSALWLPAQPHLLTWWLPVGTTLGIGVGALSVGTSSAAALSAGPARFAEATGLNLAARQVGGALGVAATSVVLAAHAAGDVDGARIVYAITAVSVLLAALPASRLGRGLLRPDPPATSPDPAAPAGARASASRTTTTTADTREVRA